MQYVELLKNIYNAVDVTFYDAINVVYLNMLCSEKYKTEILLEKY